MISDCSVGMSASVPAKFKGEMIPVVFASRLSSRLAEKTIAAPGNNDVRWSATNS